MSRTRMPLLFLILLILGVYAEFVVIINVNAEIGPAATLLAMFGTAVIGLWLVRLQGFEVFRKMTLTMQQGKSPVAEMLHGVLLLLAGFLLIIPGFISDALGVLFLIPPVRSLIIAFGPWKYFSQFEVRAKTGTQDSSVIEGEFVRGETKDPEAPALEDESHKN